mmetsp:Transcript_43024/g.80001  ORF Transcript_43024/g.80001 Transcript_43024/m.80001 type:complete len:145 (-) Transcript_43024:341-775(-)
MTQRALEEKAAKWLSCPALPPGWSTSDKGENVTQHHSEGSFVHMSNGAGSFHSRRHGGWQWNMCMTEGYETTSQRWAGEIVSALGSSRRQPFSLAASAQLPVFQTFTSPVPVAETSHRPSCEKATVDTEWEKQESLLLYLYVQS